MAHSYCYTLYRGGIYDQQDATNSQTFIIRNALHVSVHHCPSSGARNCMCSLRCYKLWGFLFIRLYCGGGFSVATRQRSVELIRNLMAHAQKPEFVFRRNGRVHLNRRWRHFSRMLAAEVCASAVVMLDTPCSEVEWRVLATHSIRQFPLHFPSRVSPSAVTFQLDCTTTETSRPEYSRLKREPHNLYTVRLHIQFRAPDDRQWCPETCREFLTKNILN
jgi:hypothetical protein